MNKQEIIKEYRQFLKDTGVKPEEFVIGAGGACVMYGIRESTDDMDMGLQNRLYLTILKSKKYPTHDFRGTTVISWNENIDLHPISPGETTIVDGVCCYSLQRLLEQKLQLNRPKDQPDIAALKVLLKKKTIIEVSGDRIKTNVRVIIFKDDKVCLCKKITDDGTFYTFPGGGVESGDDFITTVEKECLEEVGILVENIVDLNFSTKRKYTTLKKERLGTYDFNLNHFFKADFKSLDKSLYGDDNDTMPYEFVNVNEAINLLGKDKKDIYSQDRIVALRQALKPSKEPIYITEEMRLLKQHV